MASVSSKARFRKDDITDGLSSTLFAGEKYLGMDAYGTGSVGADNENEYVGMDNDIGRTTYRAPMQDRWGVNDTFAYGSAHPNAANFVFCDGSVFFDQLQRRCGDLPPPRHPLRGPAR